MKNKTCGECKHFYTSDEGQCSLKGDWGFSDDDACKDFCLPIDRLPAGVITAPKPTNGDKIMHGGNRALAEIFDDLYNGNKCKYCIHHAGSGVCKLNPTPCSEYDEGYLDDEDCLNGFEAWLNAPAESGVKDEL